MYRLRAQWSSTDETVGIALEASARVLHETIVCTEAFKLGAIYSYLQINRAFLWLFFSGFRQAEHDNVIFGWH